jgi:hypothetical protein
MKNDEILLLMVLCTLILSTFRWSVLDGMVEMLTTGLGTLKETRNQRPAQHDVCIFISRL